MVVAPANNEDAPDCVATEAAHLCLASVSLAPGQRQFSDPCDVAASTPWPAIVVVRLQTREVIVL